MDDASGIDVARGCYDRVVRPLLADRLPDLRWTAGRLGSGSDVLGFDDATSRDHDWGVRLTLIVAAGEVDGVERLLESTVPDTFDGLPTRFRFSGEQAARLHIEVCSMEDLLLPRFGFDPRAPISVDDWLSVTGQAVLEVRAGPLFRDDDDVLSRVREALRWYPEDVWRFALASDWARLGQELPVMHRAADVGDDRGSRIIAARLAQVSVHLAFLVERRWAPYSKWFGTAFRTLACAPLLGPLVDEVLEGRDGAEREHALAAALQVLLDRQNRAGLTDVATATVPFWDRPHRHTDPRIADQLMAPVDDPALRSLRRGLGTIEQRTDNVDVLVDPVARRRSAAPA